MSKRFPEWVNSEVIIKAIKMREEGMLSKQLKELELDGIINRKVHQVIPPKVEYSLTDFGLSLMPILKSLSDWNNRNSKIIATRLNKNFDENRL